MVRLCPHMDPRSEILLEETIHAIDCDVHPVPVWHGIECVVCISTGAEATNNEGKFC
jgi:hypothetical protein